MGSVKVLDFVARELDGGILTVPSVKAFVAVEKVADRLGMTATSRQAAELAVLLLKAPSEGIRDEFGQETADIVEALHAYPPHSGIASAATKLYESSESDRIRRDAAIAAFAAEAAVASAEDRETMIPWLDSMMERESDAGFRAFFEELRGQLSDPIPTDQHQEGRDETELITISIDVSGSTKAKATMRKYARDREELNKWYEAFHHQFLSLEWRFYSLLFDKANRGLGWDWNLSFVVKGVGDELWLLYRVDKANNRTLGSLFVRLMYSALEVADWAIRWTSAADDHEAGSLKTKNLPVKFYIDIIDDVFEISKPRLDFVVGRLPEILGAGENWSSRNFVELGNRLNAGSFMGDGRRLVTTFRTDYIGWEVDRFFRATKFALPGVVTVGQKLFERVVETSTASADGMRKAVVPIPVGLGGTRYDNSFRYVKQDISRNKLKGLKEGYTVYHVLGHLNLLRLHQSDMDKGIMKETFKIFTPAMADAERRAGKA